MPSIRAPIFTSIRHRSWTCGSQAVLIRHVRPGARTAAMTAFSVPVTLGSSRNTSVPLRPAGAAISIERSTPTSAPSALEGQHVRVDAAAADDVAAGRRHRDLAAAREQRAGQQDRGADAAAERAVERRLRDELGADLEVVLRRPLDACAEIGDQLAHHLDVADARDVRQPDGAIGQQRRGDDGQGGVLVAFGSDGPGEGSPTLDHEVFASPSAVPRSWPRAGHATSRPSPYHPRR